jgi:hypothetical protein
MSPEWVEEAVLRWSQETGHVFHADMLISVVEVTACDVITSIRILLQEEEEV